MVDGTNQNIVSVRLKKGKSSLEWMKRVQSGEPLVSLKTLASSTKLTPSEVAKHNKINDCWIILNGMVYDVTPYMEYHPGGGDQLMRAAGKDGTSLFNHYHNFVNYKNMLKTCLLGPCIHEKGNKRPKNRIHKAVKISWKKYDLGYYMNIKLDKESPIKIEDLCVFIHQSHQIIICLKIYDFLFQAYQFYSGEAISRVRVSIETLNVFRVNLITAFARSVLDLMTNYKLVLKDTSSINSSPNFMSDKYFLKVILSSCESVCKDVYFLKIKVEENMFYVAPLCTHTIIKMPDDDKYSYFTFVPSKLIDDENNTIAENKYITPEYDPDDNNYYIYFLIKRYSTDDVSCKLTSLNPGDYLEISIPIYTNYFHMTQLSMPKHTIYMCTGGIGITIMLRLIQYILNNLPNTRVKMLCSYQSIHEIVWKNHLDKLATIKPNIFSIMYTITRQTDSNWKGLIGRIDANMIKNFVDHTENSMLYICGSNNFIDHVTELAENLFKTKDQIIGFKG